jgi:Cu+-exporting ATPase
MSVDPDKAGATRNHEEVTFYFCSQGCAKQFDKDPHKYAHQGDKE